MTRFGPMRRRDFLRTATCAAAGAALPLRALAQDVGGALSVQALDADTAVISGAGGNVFATRGADGLILVDTGLAEHADALLDALEAHFGERRVATAFNTHWHYANTGGNAAVKQAGARILAHENTRLWLSGDFHVGWEDRHYKPLPEAMLPTDTFYTGGSVTSGGREIAYEHLRRAHTDGDIYVHLRDADIILAGDLVSVGAYPILDYATGGWIGMMSRASEALLAAAGPNTRIVPGLGPVVGREHLEKQTEMLVTVRERIFAMVRRGYGAEDMLAEGATDGFDEEWGDPTLFVTNAYPGLWANSYEIGLVV